MEFSKRDQHIGPVYRKLIEEGAHVVEFDRPGHIRVNGSVYCYVKYASSDVSPWSFGFTSNELLMLGTDLGREAALYAKAFVALVCGTDGVCLLKANEWRQLLEPLKHRRKFVQVKRPPGCQMEVRATGNLELQRKIPKNRFPDLLLQQV
jgi:hypothetical protein